MLGFESNESLVRTQSGSFIFYLIDRRQLDMFRQLALVWRVRPKQIVSLLPPTTFCWCTRAFQLHECDSRGCHLGGQSEP